LSLTASLRAAVVVTTLVLLTPACGGGGAPADEHAGHSAGTGATVDVTIKDGKAEPSGKVVEVGKGEQVTLNITSDIDDEIHVHSTPDHSFPVTAGQQLQETFSFGAPGTYEMESHRLEKLIVKFEVR
jgi:hypothetical protein